MSFGTIRSSRTAKSDREEWKAKKTAAQRWGIILAGGDGTRLKSLTRFIYGDERPKQFCSVLGEQTLLRQSTERIKDSIRPERTLYALTAAHESYYHQELIHSRSLRLVQPVNRGTAPPIILGLLQIAFQAPDSLVAVLPSDHYYSNEGAFKASLERAFEIADEKRDSIVLMGAQPTAPDSELGWIELGNRVGVDLFAVGGFQEKPLSPVAEDLFKAGSLWNTFVMVGHVLRFLCMTFAAVPDLFAELEGAFPLHDIDHEVRVPRALYDRIPAVDFSKQILSSQAKSLLAMRLVGMEWHDLGQTDRIVNLMRSQKGIRSSWMDAWELACIAGQPF